MKSPAAWWGFVRARLDRRALDREMDEEMALHIALHAEALERAGLSSAEARRRAVAEFGGVQRYREESRDARSLAWLHDLVGDLRYGVRTLRRSPAFTTVSVLSLGLGIGANVAIFGLLYGLLLQPLPVPRAKELSALVLEYKGVAGASVLHATYRALRQAPGTPPMVAEHESDDVLTETAHAAQYSRVLLVDGGLFRLVGVRPLLGRVMTPEEEEQYTPVVVLSEDAWTRFFDRDREVIGKQLRLHGYPFTVIGVMPRAFRGLRFNGSFTMAVPATFGTLLGTPEARHYVNVLTRLETPALRAAYVVPLQAAFKRCCLDAEHVGDGVELSFVDASRGLPYGKADFRDDYRLVLWSLMGGVLLVLLVACSNVGNLLLARAATRERELSIRLSIGASRSRVVRQLLAESVLIAALGGAVGLALAATTTQLLLARVPGEFSTAAALVEFHPKPAILLFTAAVGMLSVLAFGVGPALRATGQDPAALLKDRSGSRPRETRLVDRMLVVAQVALTLVLVCGAGLLVATLRNLRAIDPGFVAHHLAAIEVETRGTAYEPNGIVPIHREILERARGVPGITSAAMATLVPAIGGRNINFPYSVVGQPRLDSARVWVTVVTPGYFATVRTPIVVGRDLGDADISGGERVGVVSEAFVRQHFAGQSPLGAQIRLDGLEGGVTVRIVGVARDVRFGDRRAEPDPFLYIPAAQAGKWPFFLLVMRTGPEPRQVMPQLTRALGSYAQRVQITNLETMDEATDAVLLRERLGAALASTCALLALTLAMVGLAGLVGFSVARRTREIGVRMALGANAGSVVWLVLRGAMAMTVVGVVIGGPLAVGAGRALQSLLYGIAPANAVLLLGSSVALVAVTILAAAAPAWRAARVDPLIALRAD